MLCITINKFQTINLNIKEIELIILIELQNIIYCISFFSLKHITIL